MDGCLRRKVMGLEKSRKEGAAEGRHFGIEGQEELLWEGFMRLN